MVIKEVNTQSTGDQLTDQNKMMVWEFFYAMVGNLGPSSAFFPQSM